MTSREQTIAEIQHQVRQEIAMQLIDLLPVPTIAKVCNMTEEQVLALVRPYEPNGTDTREQSDRKSPRTIKLLDQPINKITVPIANSTKHAINRNKEALSKLQEYLKG